MNAEIPTASEMVNRYQQRRKTKRFGQHFLTDPNILDRIVDLSETPIHVPVLEIGPGCGTLTTALLNRGHKVTAIELDRDLCRFLTQQKLPGLTLIEGDAVKLDLSKYNLQHVVANLPYNASTKILFKLLRMHYEQLTLMFQKEVAVRICSEPNCKAYGSLSVLAQLLSEPKITMNLAPGAFSPPPKVDSAIVNFRWRRKIDDKDISKVEKFVRSSFAMRRKKITNNLGRFYDKEILIEALEELGLDIKIRAENISPEAFLSLYKIVRKSAKLK